ncbi:DUF294 nucleotidyltransferase-like domain-containing protein [Chelativorans alearense]|uniref:DUF294 nucleotidyltransferase-like domain-containing protein n=1 Tax=Chelativorans alearense TaxID=2681495 RepID=UPI0013D17D89|nr:DUF294 nucleotidyltransferase-like domain-containing protein [Chelativorans alearense]
MQAVVGAVPLIALDAVAIDTETTGLDPRKARIVQLGGVAIAGGAMRPDRTFETLVDPAVPIPPEAMRIHGITNAMVRQAPSFATAWERFEAFRAGRLLVGYAVGFDMAVAKQEARRAGLEWKRPRTLCVRTLSHLVNPELRDPSLEAIAAWLGIEVTGRHQALGDAISAAKIFAALLPRLQACGVRTLAEAERSLLRLAKERERQHKAGWDAPASSPETLPSFAAVDPFAYRHHVGDLMRRPPVLVRDETPLRAAMALMMERKTGSILVSKSGEPGGPVGDYGIITERDVLRLVAVQGERSFERPAGALASRPLVSIRAQAFAYRAIGRMERLGIRHLGVRDEKDALAGVISARDLLRLRASVAIQLDDTIDAANSTAEMAAAWASLPTVANALAAEEVDAGIVAEIVSEELRAMTRRAAVLAEQEMRDVGLGGPPSPYAVLVLGSAGRGESLLAADQDNAIVYESGEPDGPEDRWFAALGERIAAMLDTAGIAYCNGGVMAKNAEWRGSLALWKERVGQWVRRSRPQDLLNVDIFFDLSPVHGDRGLGEALFEEAYQRGHAEAPFPLLLGEQLANLASPFTLFGRFRTEEGRLDLKRFALFPIVSAARTLSIRHDIRVRSTRARLEGLLEREIGSEVSLQRVLSAHTLVLSLTLAQQSRDRHEGIPVSNKVEIAALSRSQQAALRIALRDLQILPELVRDLM